MLELDPNKMIEDAISKARDCFTVGELDYGKEILEQVLRCDPDQQDALQLLGVFHHRCRRYTDAIPLFTKAIKLDPKNPDNYNNLALCETSLRDVDAAIEHLKTAVRLNPNEVKYRNNLALQYRHKRDYDTAIKISQEAIDIDPSHTQVWSNLGGMFGETHQLDKAVECYRRILEIEPDSPSAHVDLAYTYALQGNFKKSWVEYEYRFEFFENLWFYNNKYNPELRLKHLYLDLTGKTVILYCEQGLGDAINFVRYIPEFKSRFADCRVILHCSEIQKSLFQHSDNLLIDDFFIENIVTVKSVPTHDYHASVMSLPYLLSLDKIPKTPYLRETRKASLGYDDFFKIGICWAGSPQHPNDSIRSCPLKYFKPIHDIPGVKLFSLQQNLSPRIHSPTTQPVDYADGAEGISAIDLSPYMTDFEKTANLLADLNLVVTVDTAILHLAGAMGVKTIGLLSYNPDWRWGLTGETTPWYDSLTLVRQDKSGGWGEVFEKATNKIKEIQNDNDLLSSQ